jgi:trimeric autotransporter adhesin
VRPPFKAPCEDGSWFRAELDSPAHAGQFNNPTSTKKQKMKTKNMTTLRLRKSMGPECFRGCLLIALAVACFGLSPALQAVTPAPDGGYPGNNTAEGQNALFSLTTGLNNTALGFDALFHNMTGSYNTATGEQTLYQNTTANYNTANGYRALYSNTTGAKNTADGFRALFLNTTGAENTANGFQALYSNTTGFDNTAVGLDALYHNTTGDSNTATGHLALFNNATGTQNTATGFQALGGNTGASFNVANGYQALFHNTVDGNTANGYQALFNNTTGTENTATGDQALFNNTSSQFNVAVGDSALLNFNDTTAGFGGNTALGSIALTAETNGEENVAVGRRALEFLLTGSNNTAVGWRAGDNYTGGESGNICIGSDVAGVTGESNKTRIGNITSTTFTTGGFFLYEVNGAIGIFTSSRKFKDDIKPIDKASETIYSLNPVTFRAKPETDPSRPRGFGLIAEEVEQVNPDLVSHGKNDILGVRYESINAMLLNEFLKEHKKVQGEETAITQLKSTAAKQEATIAKQQKQIEALTMGLQKVSDQLQLSKTAPRTVVNN